MSEASAPPIWRCEATALPPKCAKPQPHPLGSSKPQPPRMCEAKAPQCTSDSKFPFPIPKKNFAFAWAHLLGNLAAAMCTDTMDSATLAERNVHICRQTRRRSQSECAAIAHDDGNVCVTFETPCGQSCAGRPGPPLCAMHQVPLLAWHWFLALPLLLLVSVEPPPPQEAQNVSKWHFGQGCAILGAPIFVLGQKFSHTSKKGGGWMRGGGTFGAKGIFLCNVSEWVGGGKEIA